MMCMRRRQQLRLTKLGSEWLSNKREDRELEKDAFKLSTQWFNLHRGFDPGQNTRTNQLQSCIPLLQSNDKGMLDCSWLVLTFQLGSNPRCKLGSCNPSMKATFTPLRPPAKGRATLHAKIELRMYIDNTE